MNKPADRPKVTDAVPLIRALYARHGGGAGCCLHIVTDDKNIDDHCVQFCADYAQERGHDDCRRLAEMLLAMTRTQRLKACRRH